MLYTEDFSMGHYVGFSQIGSQITNTQPQFVLQYHPVVRTMDYLLNFRYTGMVLYVLWLHRALRDLVLVPSTPDCGHVNQTSFS